MQREIKIGNKAFTLIELLVTLTVIAIILSIVLFTFSLSTKKVEMEVSNITKENLINASGIYFTEYQDSFVWHDNKDGTKTSCINIDNLINKGLLDGKNEEIKKIKNDKAILINRKNEVNTYTVGTPDDCVFWEYDSSDVINNTPHYSINGDNLGGGNISQGITKEDDEYVITLNFNTKNFEQTIVNRKLYVAVALDQSGSMRGSPYNNAVSASKTLANILVNSSPNSQIGLVLYDSSASVVRGFKHENFNNVSFGSASGGTDIADALSTSGSMFNNIKEDDVSKIIVLLTDGIDSGYTNIAAQLRNSGIIIMTVGYEVDDATLKSIASVNDKGQRYYYEAGVGNIEQAFKDIAEDIKKEVSDINKMKIELTPPSQFYISNVSGNGTYKDGTITYEIDLSDKTEEVTNAVFSYRAKLNIEIDGKTDYTEKIKVYSMKIILYKKDGKTEVIVPDDKNVPYIDFITKEVNVSGQ